MGLYETLKAAKLGAAPDVLTKLRAQIAPFAKGGGTSEKELEDTPPLSFTGNGQPLLDWNIDGASGGVGDITANIIPEIRAANGWVVGYRSSTNGNYTTNHNNGEWLSPKIAISAGDKITISAMSITNPSMSVYFWNGDTYLSAQGSENYNGATFTAPANTTQIDFAIRAGADKKTEEAVISNGFWVMVNLGSTAKTYEPYGKYKIPVTCGGETNTIYLNAPLGASDSISMTDTGISIPTVDGSNTLTVGTTVQPSSVYIKYKE